MSESIVATMSNGDKGEFEIDVFPDTCPICQRGIQAGPEFGASHGPDTDALQVVFRCPVRKCGRLFIATYRRHGDFRGHLFSLSSLAPRKPVTPEYPEEVSELSPAFTEIASQSRAAEDYGLTQIAGVGYRKALEFLIKDYCIHQDPSASQGVKAEFLGHTIRNRVTEPRIRTCAERATWLGNDETHYERRWEGKELTDLKVLIELTMNWIVSDVLTKRYESEMPDS